MEAIALGKVRGAKSVIRMDYPSNDTLTARAYHGKRRPLNRDGLEPAQLPIRQLH